MSKKNFCTMYPNRIFLWFAYRGHLCLQLPFQGKERVLFALKIATYDNLLLLLIKLPSRNSR